MTVALADCEQHDIISFGEGLRKYHVVKCEERFPDDGAKWVWEAVIVPVGRTNSVPVGLDDNLYGIHDAFYIEFTDPNHPQIYYHEKADQEGVTDD